MVVRYTALAALAAASLWALLTVGASNGQSLLADTGQEGNEREIVLVLLGAIAAAMTFSLGRFLVLGRPPMVDGWYEQNKQWIYVILGGGVLFAAYVLT
jgi:TctA family transporter